jgi:hypothetical protein
MNSKLAVPTYTALGFIDEALLTLTVVFPVWEMLYMLPFHLSCYRKAPTQLFSCNNSLYPLLIYGFCNLFSAHEDLPLAFMEQVNVVDR